MVNHGPTSTEVSSASTLSLLSDEDFNRCVLEDMDNEDNTTERYVHTAGQYLKKLPSTLQIGGGIGLEALPILRSMLKHAPNDRGKRYASCAIIAASTSILDQSPGLVSLASDWLKFLLLPFKSAYKNYSPPASDYISPTLDETAINMTNVPDIRPSDFRQRLIERQNGECATIIRSPATAMETEGAHIIKRSLATPEPAGTASREITWDIIAHFAGIQVSHLESDIDSPENGMLLETTMHRQFDKFNWCLIPTVTPNSYEVKWLAPPLHYYTLAKRDSVNFQKVHHKPIGLPNPRFLALHAAMAHILHETSVGKYLDNVMEIFIPNVSKQFGSQKFGEEDLALRLSLVTIAGSSWHHLPNEIAAY